MGRNSGGREDENSQKPREPGGVRPEQGVWEECMPWASWLSGVDSATWWSTELLTSSADIQECYEATLKLNTEHKQEVGAWPSNPGEPREEPKAEEASLVRVTSRRSPHKVERVSGVVARSCIHTPEVSWGIGRLGVHLFAAPL
ncbi:disks large homolog 3 isoform X12 [Arapaima gigas]